MIRPDVKSGFSFFNNLNISYELVFTGFSHSFQPINSLEKQIKIIELLRLNSVNRLHILQPNIYDISMRYMYE